MFYNKHLFICALFWRLLRRSCEGQGYLDDVAVQVEVLRAVRRGLLMLVYVSEKGSLL